VLPFCEEMHQRKVLRKKQLNFVISILMALMDYATLPVAVVVSLVMALCMNSLEVGTKHLNLILRA
jgi:hypothetical protein